MAWGGVNKEKGIEVNILILMMYKILRDKQQEPAVHHREFY